MFSDKPSDIDKIIASVLATFRYENEVPVDRRVELTEERMNQLYNEEKQFKVKDEELATIRSAFADEFRDSLAKLKINNKKANPTL